MFQFLDHPSEAYVEVRGATVEEVFHDAAVALFEVMTDVSALSNEILFPVALTASGRDSLLVEWLNRLILIHEVELVFLAHFEIHALGRTGNDWKVEAFAAGERIKENHERRSHVKSATFGSFEWIESPDGHTVRFVLDV